MAEKLGAKNWAANFRGKQLSQNFGHNIFAAN
jgi:hypothetical protein